jgi:dihydropteroate synthase
MRIKASSLTLRCRNRTLTFETPLVMGIVNINDDSFSGDGSLEIEDALILTHQHIAAGAEIIDVGAESARTNRSAISPEDEVARLIPYIDWFHHEFPDGPLLSINTWRSTVVRQVLPMGVDILNDISALPISENAKLCADHSTALLIMHSVGVPKIPHLTQQYPDIWTELVSFFSEKIALAESAGLSRDQIILDPGIDFAKQRDDNLSIYREIGALHAFECPILLPVSRKTVIGEVLDISDPVDRDAGTVACITHGLTKGAQIFRVHNTAAAVQTIKTVWPLIND